MQNASNKRGPPSTPNDPNKKAKVTFNSNKRKADEHSQQPPAKKNVGMTGISKGAMPPNEMKMALGNGTNPADLANMSSGCLFHEAKPAIIERYVNPNCSTGFQDIFIQPQWDPRYTVGCFGSRGTGKSYWLRFLAAIQAPYFTEVYVFTETTQNKYWAQMCNPKFIIKGFNKEAIIRIFKIQAQKVNDWREGKWNGNPHVLMIWDDCVPEDLYWDPVFRWMFFNGRHFYIGIWFNCQYFYRIPPGYRGNFDWVCSLAQDQGRQVEAFFEEMAFSVGFCKKILMMSFVDMFKDATLNRGIIIFDIRNKEDLIQNRIYKITAEDPGIFWMGSYDYWKNNLKHLEQIRSGKARDQAEKEMKYAEYGLIDPKDPVKVGGRANVASDTNFSIQDYSNSRYSDPRGTYDPSNRNGGLALTVPNIDIDAHGQQEDQGAYLNLLNQV